MSVSLGMMGRMMTLNVDSKPRHMVFSKIECLITRMNDQRTGGIQLRNKKNFLTTIHSSFSGNDVVTWLSVHLCGEDTVEALHLASFLCMYGYIYPVDLKSFFVRDDKSVLYRFQSAYYWPSKNLKLTNEKFVIYLLKRSKRNKQKHGLDEYEQIALTKLQTLFPSDKMDFVKRQADEQVKQVKNMKKDDKTFHDSQERAFWRVHRPPPNHVKCLEEGPSRCFQPSQMLSRKKQNRDIKLTEVQYLRRAISRPRLKFSKSVEIFVLRDTKYLEYDPFLDPLAAQPSNPWHSDDELMWEINRNMVDIPTVTRIRKWGLSFADLLKDETGRNEFEQFLKKEYSQENIRFYLACKELIVSPLSKVSTWKSNIQSEFLTPGAPCEVNIDCKTMESVTQQLKAENCVNRHIFQPAMDHVYALMKKDSYTRFIRSDQYNSLLGVAQVHYTKKRFFNFGSNRRRIPSPQPRRRGSSSSDATGGEDPIGGPSYHSYSTGNLREFDEKPKRSFRQSNSPALRRRADHDRLVAGNDDRRRSNLEVPQNSGVATTTSNPSDASRKSENMNMCLAISVPRNVIAPWEGNS